LVGTEAGIVGRLWGEILVSIRARAAVQSVLEGRDGTIWAIAGDRLHHYPSDLLSAAPAVVSLPSNWLSGPVQYPGLSRVLNGRRWLSQDANGAIWTTGEDGVGEPIDAQRNLPRASGNPNIRAILRASGGTTWIGTGGSGLLRSGGGKLEHWTQSAGLADDSVSSLFEDREHNLWVGTHNGLQRLHDSKIKPWRARMDWRATRLTPSHRRLTGLSGPPPLGE
jgi:hypothetical protein